jgi:hypothetical protein
MTATLTKPNTYKEYEISFPGFFRDNPNYSKIITSTSQGAARYECFLEFSDAYEMTFFDFIKITTCHLVKAVDFRESETVILEQKRRIDIVNKIILEIGSRSHRSLYSNSQDRYGRFEKVGPFIKYIDQYSGVPIKMAPNSTTKDSTAKHYFSSGGTMWGLVNDFKDYILGDDDANHNNGYGGLYCLHWGYPVEDMEAIRKLATELGYLKHEP